MVFAIVSIVDFAWEYSLYVEMGFCLLQFIHNLNTMYMKLPVFGENWLTIDMLNLYQGIWKFICMFYPFSTIRCHW